MMNCKRFNVFDDMDNGAYNRDPEKGTELLEQSKKGVKGANGNVENQQASTSCRPDVCQAARARYPPPDLSGGPWHRKKSIFLGITISALIVWIIVYSTLSTLKLL